MKRTLALALSLACMAGVLTGCSQSDDASSSKPSSSSTAPLTSNPPAHEPGLFIDGKKVDADPIISLDNEEISLEEYRFHYMNALAMVGGADSEALKGEKGEELKAYIRDSAEHSLKLSRLYRKLAKEHNLKLSDDIKKEMDESIESVKNDVGDEEFLKILQAQYYGSEENYRRTMEDVFLQKLVIENVFGDEILDNVKKNYVHVQHILIPFEETEPASSSSGSESASQTEPDHEKERKEAEKVLKKAKDGEDFSKLMEKYNQDPGQPPEGYTFPKGVMVPEFEDASYALKEGEISDIVETGYGYHIIKRLPIDEKYVKENSVQYLDNHISKILQEELQPRLDEMKLVPGKYYDQLSPETLF